MNNVINIINNKEKLYDIEYSQPTGIDGEKIRYVIEGIPKRNDSNLQLGIKPNMNGIDIVSNHNGNGSTIKVELYDKNKKLKLAKNFKIPIDKGLRLRPLSALNKGLLKTAQIDEIGGDFRESKII